MDTIFTAIVSSLGKLSEEVIKDAYNALKGIIIKKFGKKSDLTGAIENLEKKPDSTGRRETLKEEIVAAKADQDDEVIKVAEALIEKLEAQPGERTTVQQTVIGNQNVFSGTGKVTATFGKTKDKK